MRPMKTILLAALVLALSKPVTIAQAPEHPFVKAIGEKLTNPKKRFTLIVKVTVKEGEAEKFIAAFAEAVELTRKEDGCSRYELNQMNGTNTFVDPDLIVLTPKADPVKPKTDVAKSKTAAEELENRTKAAAREAAEDVKKADAEIKKALDEAQKGKKDSGTK